jgi:hypothetical protein
VIRSSAWFVLLLAFTAASAHAAAKLAKLEGDVKVRKAGSQLFRETRPGADLVKGDRVRVGTGGRAVVVVDGQPVSVGPGETYLVGESEGAGVQAGGTALAALKSAASEGETLSRPGGVGLRKMALKNGVTLIAPVNARISDSRPEFRWSAAAGKPGATYELRLKKKGRVVWETPTKATSASYPASAPALAPGETYFWTVAVKGEPEGQLQEAFFQVLSGRPGKTR